MGYDPRTGKEIWRVVYGDDNTISRIVTGHGLMFVNCGGVSTRLWAVRTGGKGDITDTHVAWKLADDVLAENQIDGGFYASAAIAKRSFILRTKTDLYRIEKL